MEQKLSWVKLRNQVAENTGLSQKAVNTLLRAGLECIMDALRAGDTVRLGDLGSFKAQTMAPRKSIDVNTGQEIILNSYQRVSYTPSDALKAAMNGERTPQLTPATDPIRKLNDQAIEIIDILGELGQGPKAKEEEKEERKEKPEEPIKPREPEVPIKPKKPDYVFRPWLTTGITILVFCLLLVAGYFFLRHKIIEWADELQYKTEGVADDGTLHGVEALDEAVFEPIVTDSLEKKDSILQSLEDEFDAISNADPQDVPQASEKATSERVYTSFLATEKINPGSRLAWLAYRYYGHKELWVFIYEANQDHLTNPSAIRIGTPIKIPNLSNELRDVNNPQTRQLIEQLQEQYLNQ